MSSKITAIANQSAAQAGPDARLPRVKAEELRDQVLATKGLSSLDADATLQVFAAALLAESEDGYSREAALGILRRARRVTPEALAEAAARVTEQLAGIMSAFWNEFIQETWQGPGDPPAFVDPATVSKRKDLEEQEQEQNRKDALQYIGNAQTAISALLIDEKEFPKAATPPARQGPRLDVNNIVHRLIFKPPPPKGNGPAQAAPGWLTPPVIKKDDENVTVFDHDIMQVVGDKKLSGDQAWKKLEDRGYDRPRIVRTIYEVRKMAQDQIAQCDQIVSFIRNDYETHIEPVVKAAVLLGHAISVVNSFYAPLPSAAGEQSASPPPSRPPTRSKGRPTGR